MKMIYAVSAAVTFSSLVTGCLGADTNAVGPGRAYGFVERDWLYKCWKAGLPKRHPNMHFFLNAFPYANCKRPVGPESDPHSNLGMMKWLIQEIRVESH